MHQPTTKTVGSDKLCSPHAGQKSCVLFSEEKEAPSALHLSIIKTLLHCDSKEEPSNFSKDCGGADALMAVLQEYEDLFWLYFSFFLLISLRAEQSFCSRSFYRKVFCPDNCPQCPTSSICIVPLLTDMQV